MAGQASNQNLLCNASDYADNLSTKLAWPNQAKMLYMVETTLSRAFGGSNSAG